MAPAMALANLIVTPNSISGITVVQNDTAMASASVTESGTTNYYEISPSGSGAPSYVSFTSNCPFSPAVQSPSCTLDITVDATGLTPGPYSSTLSLDYFFAGDVDISGFLFPRSLAQLLSRSVSLLSSLIPMAMVFPIAVIFVQVPRRVRR